MANQQLIEYVKLLLKEGLSKEQIKADLQSKGWANLIIDEAIDGAVIQPQAPQPQVQAQPTSNKRNYKAVWAILGMLLLIGAGGFGGYYLSNKTANTPEIPENKEGISSSASQSAGCDNYECLIAAAQSCSPLSATIRYSNVSSPLLEGFTGSGVNKYQLTKSTVQGKCIFSMQSVEVSYGLTAAGRERARSDGLTDAEIDAFMQSANESAKDTENIVTTCDSPIVAIVSYLNDLKNNATSGSTNVSAQLGATGGTVTITMTSSSGQKLLCSQTQI